MVTTIDESLSPLRNLGSVDELRALADRERGAGAVLAANAHIHLPPNFSAFETVEQAVRQAADEGLRALGVSNYYDFMVYGEFAAHTARAGIFPLFGLEIICLDRTLERAGVRINDPGNPGRFYLCGKGMSRFDAFTPRAEELMRRIRSADSARMAKMIRSLGEALRGHGVDARLTEEDVIESVMRRNSAPRDRVILQERHISRAYQEALSAGEAQARETFLRDVLEMDSEDAGNAVAIQNRLRSRFMKAGRPAYVEETFIAFDEARELTLELGGYPCYPVLADGADPLCEFEAPVARLIEEIRSRGIHAVEFIPVRNSPETLEAYVRPMRRAGLIVSAGTEHNTLDRIRLTPMCLHGARIPDEIQKIFWEGACVCAAHQFLALRGECGFVDGRGRPNPAFPGDEERIATFRKLGAAIIRRFAGDGI